MILAHVGCLESPPDETPFWRLLQLGLTLWVLRGSDAILCGITMHLKSRMRVGLRGSVSLHRPLRDPQQAASSSMIAVVHSYFDHDFANITHIGRFITELTECKAHTKQNCNQVGSCSEASPAGQTSAAAGQPVGRSLASSSQHEREAASARPRS